MWCHFLYHRKPIPFSVLKKNNLMQPNLHLNLLKSPQPVLIDFLKQKLDYKVRDGQKAISIDFYSCPDSIGRYKNQSLPFLN